jgi:hypothetical protein
MPVTLPFNPGMIEMSGAQPNSGNLQALITALSQNMAPRRGVWRFTADTTATAITYTTASVLGGLIQRSGGTTPTDVLPNASLLTAVWPGVFIGASSPLFIQNLHSGTLTLAQSADATTTLAGTTTVATTGIRAYLLTVTACQVDIIDLQYSNQIAVITTNLPHGLAVGGNAVVANTINTNWNATWTVAAVPTAYSLVFAAPTSVVTAGTNSTIPNLTPDNPALLNTPSAITCTGCFAWPATTIA